MKYEGEWWFPKYDNNKFKGTLTFSQKYGGRLLINGIISSDLFLDQYFHNNNDTIILGQMSNGKKMTLQVNKFHNSINILSDDASMEFDVKVILIGIHFKKLDDIKFNSVRIYYQNCDKWFTKPTLYEVRPNKRFNKYSYHDPIFIEDENRSEYEIKIFAKTKILYENHKPILNKKIYNDIICKDKISFADYQNTYNIINDFFNFLSHEDIIISSIEGNYSLNDGNCINHIKIIYQNFNEKMNKIKTMIPYNIRYDKILNNFNNLFLNWIKIKNELSIVYDLFFGVMYNPDLYLSNMLQMFTECLENYHREFMEKNSIIKVERKMKRDRVMKDLENLIILAKKEKLSVFVNNSDLDWLKDKVKNISPTLRERISEIYDKYLDLIKIFSTIEEKEEFLKKVKCYRDNFSHAKLKYHTIDNEDLLWTVEKLHLFVKLVFLTRLGFTNENIKRLYIPENV